MNNRKNTPTNVKQPDSEDEKNLAQSYCHSTYLQHLKRGPLLTHSTYSDCKIHAHKKVAKLKLRN